MKIHQLKITLKHIKPPIWRRLEVPADIKLGKLHEVIQIAMGWTDSHMHAFIAGQTVYGTPDPEFGGGTKNERNVQLDGIVKEGGKLIYEYDLGDGWEHEIKVEKVFDADPASRYPRCTDGKRACPPDDCGGPYGYEEFLAAIGDSTHPEHEEMLEWIGGEFDPEAFDLAQVNQALWRMR